MGKTHVPASRTHTRDVPAMDEICMSGGFSPESRHAFSSSSVQNVPLKPGCVSWRDADRQRPSNRINPYPRPHKEKALHPCGTKGLSVVPPEFIVSENATDGRIVSGGPEGARTPDLIHAMDALFQLRYRPLCSEICTHYTRYRE